MVKGYRRLSQAEINQRLSAAKGDIINPVDTFLGYDDTDHVAFFCGKCFGVMDVGKVETVKHPVFTDGARDNCTYIELFCPACNKRAVRKFYWVVEDGVFCYQGRPKQSGEVLKRKLEAGDVR